MRSEQQVTDSSVQLALTAAHQGQPQGGASRTALRFSLATAGALLLLLIAQRELTLPNPLALGQSSDIPGAGAVVEFTSVNTYASLEWPVDVAVDRDGRRYVSDRTAGVIQVFDASGISVGSIGTAGDGTGGPLEAPLGLALDDHARLYVADYALQRVLIYTTDGVFVGEFASAFFDEGERIPSALHYQDGRLYVTDLAEHEVLVFSAIGELERTLGTGYGTKVGALRYPNGIWVGADGVAWVADTNNDRVQRYAADGTPLGQWGPLVANPRDITVDGDGRLFVASALANSIVVIDENGKRVDEIRNSPNGRMAAPTGVALWDGRVIATDRFLGEVHEWAEQ